MRVCSRNAKGVQLMRVYHTDEDDGFGPVMLQVDNPGSFVMRLADVAESLLPSLETYEEQYQRIGEKRKRIPNPVGEFVYILYDFVPLLAKGSILDRSQLDRIMHILDVYQYHEKKYRDAEIEEMGENWGSAISRIDYGDHNYLIARKEPASV